MTGRTRKADKELTDSIEGGIDVADMQRSLARDLLDIRGDHKGYQQPSALAFSPDDAYCSPWRNMRHTLSFGDYRHHTVRHQDVSLEAARQHGEVVVVGVAQVQPDGDGLIR